MYELLAFKVGVWAGYLITSFFMLLFLGFYMAVRLKKFDKFLREKKLSQSFSDWEFNNRSKLEKVFE